MDERRSLFRQVVGRTQKEDIDRNKYIVDHPEIVRDMSVEQLLKEKVRIEKNLQDIREIRDHLYPEKKPVLDRIWDNLEVQKDLDEKAAYDLKGWDRIKLTRGEVKAISDITRDQMMEDPDYWVLKHVAVRKLAVEFLDEIYYFTVLSANMLHVRIWENDPEAQCFSMEYDIRINETTKTKRRFELRNISEKTDEATIEFMKQESDESGILNFELTALIFLMINCFFLHYKDVAFNVREVVCKGPSRKVNNPQIKAETRVVRLVKQYTLKKNWQTKVERRKAEIRCQAWGVRGHFRHYKDGRVIFIEAYVKGKDRAQYQGKVYELLPKEDKNALHYSDCHQG